ncbi:MAG: thioesterase family protein [Bacteroidales bacterium]|nr:thioesterase family protein [Bacteroidales bacterium]
MSRIKISLNKPFIFETLISIQISDINYGGHLANDAVLRLAHEARLRFLTDLSYSEKDIEGRSLIMTDAAIQYKSEGHYGDKLKIRIGVDGITRLGFDLIYSMTNSETGKEVATVKTGMAFFNYVEGKLTGTPEKFISIIESYNESDT